MSIDLNFVELTADVLENNFINNTRSGRSITVRGATSGDIGGIVVLIAVAAAVVVVAVCYR